MQDLRKTETITTDLFHPTSVSIYGGTHTTALPERQAGFERALPVSIGRDSWIGGNVTIM